MKLNRLIPFRLKPGSIGLKGKAYDIAEAYHDFDGEDLERRLAEIEAGDDANKLKKALLDIDVKHKHKSQFDADCEYADIDKDDKNLPDEKKIKLAELKIEHHVGDPYWCEIEIAELKHNDEDRELALLKIEYDYEKITELDYEKKVATIKNEPWIAVIDSKFNPIEGINGLSMEFEWNEQMILYLRANGYTGMNDGDVVDRWLQDVNRFVEGDETGYDFVSNGPTSSMRVDNGDGSASYL